MSIDFNAAVQTTINIQQWTDSNRYSDIDRRKSTSQVDGTKPTVLQIEQLDLETTSRRRMGCGFNSSWGGCGHNWTAGWFSVQYHYKCRRGARNEHDC